MSIEKVAQIAMLYDFYGQMLTDKQQQLIELYYHDDLSLGEIAQEYNVSRQAVYDMLKRSEKILQDYETKLKLVAKYQREREVLAQIKVLLAGLPQNCSTEHLTEINQLLSHLLD